MADDLERRMFSDIMGSLRPKTVGGAVASSSFTSTPQTHAANTSATLGVVLQRLSLLETENEQLRAKLARCHCAARGGPAGSERKNADDDEADGKEEEDEDEEELRESDRLWFENRQLKDKLGEIEQFLLEYGLVWVGNHPASSSAASVATTGSDSARTATAGSDGRVAAAPDYRGNAAAAAPLAPSFDPEELVDFPVLFLRIQQLNELVGAGKARVVNINGVHRFEVPKELPLYLYREGIVVGSSLMPANEAASQGKTASLSGKFRRYDEESVRLFLQDILDGYFPSELRHDYPEGVPLCVIDRHATESHPSIAAAQASATRLAMAGGGNVIGGSAAGGGGSIADRLQRLSQLGGADYFQAGAAGGAAASGGTVGSASGANASRPPLSAAALLNALPSRVVASNGSLVEVKKGVQELLTSPATATTATTENTTASASGGNPASSVGVTAAAAKAAGNCLIQLRVQQQQTPTSSGSSTFASSVVSPVTAGPTTVTVQVPIAGTVKDLRAAAEAAGFSPSSAFGGSAYELRTAFPKKAVLDDDSASLVSCGLAPNGGVVHLNYVVK